MNLEPEVLLQAARGGDEPALGRLLDRYRNYLSVLTHLRLEGDLQAKVGTSDVIQETFVRACEKFPQFRGKTEAELLGWLRQILATILANTVRHYRSRGRNHLRETRLAEDLNASSQALGRVLPSREGSPSQQASHREQVVLLADAMAGLPEHYREVLLLRHVKDCTFPEIAAHMGRSVGSVEKLWIRALARLRDILGEVE